MRLEVLHQREMEKLSGIVPERYLSGNDRLFLSALDEGGLCGIAVYTMAVPDSYLDYIYVLPEKRRQGVGRFLVEKFIDKAEQMGVGNLLVSFGGEAEGRGFFEGMGFYLSEGAESFSFSTADLKDLDRVRLISRKRIPDRLKAFDRLGPIELKSVKKYLTDNNSRIEDVSGPDFSTKYSSVVFDRKGNPRSCMLCSRNQERIILDMILAGRGAELSIILLLGHLCRSLLAEEEKLTVYFTATNPKVAELAGAILGDSLENMGKSILAVTVVSGR